MKKVLLSLFAFAVIISIALLWHEYTVRDLHHPIDIHDVSRIELICGNYTRAATTEEKNNIINWFNSATNIRNNEERRGGTPESGIRIELQQGTMIGIWDCEKYDIEVQRWSNLGGKLICYWAKQPEIKQLLKQHRAEHSQDNIWGEPVRR